MKSAKRFFTERKEEIVILAVYAAVLTVLLFFHEPWSDEAQAWMIATHASLARLFELAGYEGSPVLWHLLQMPLAKIGAPYWSQQLLHGVLAVISTGLVVLLAPIKRYQRWLFVFGYYVLYEYGVIARSYVLIFLFLFLFAALYKERLRRPFLIWVPLVFLAQANVFGLWLALALAVWLLIDRLRSKKLRSGRFWLGAALTLGSGLLAFWSLLPPVDLLGPLSGWDFTFLFWVRVRDFILIAVASFSPFPVWGQHFWNNPWWTNPFIAVTGVLAFVASFVAVYLRSQVIGYLYSGIMIGTFFILFWKNIKTIRHLGLLFGMFVFCYWLASLEKSKHRVSSVIFGSLLFLQIPMTAMAVPDEVLRPFSSAELVADYMKEELKVDERTVLISSETLFVGVMPFMAETHDEFYLLSTQEWTQYAIWKDELYYDISTTEAYLNNRVVEAVQLIDQEREVDRYLMTVRTWGQSYPGLERKFQYLTQFSDAVFPGNGFIIFDVTCARDNSCADDGK